MAILNYNGLYDWCLLTFSYSLSLIQGSTTATAEEGYLGIPGTISHFYSGNQLAERMTTIANTADGIVRGKFEIFC